MAGLPRVISPLTKLGEREGVEIVLVSVEAWPDEVVVRVRGLPSPTTERLKDEFAGALEQWHREGREGRAPDQPAERILGFDVRVEDDCGTAYRLRAAARGGSGTMFRADWTFAPGPPDTARRLTVTLGDGAAAEIDLTAG